LNYPKPNLRFIKGYIEFLEQAGIENGTSKKYWKPLPKKKQMKFKATLYNVAHLHHIFQCLEKVSKLCILHLHRESIGFIVKSDAKDGIEVWGKVKCDTLFNDFRIESKTDNNIYMELSLKNMLQVLSNCARIVMKLSKKDNQIYLTCDTSPTRSYQSSASESISIIKDIPVRILSSREAMNLKEVATSDCQVQIVLPPSLKELKDIIDRMKSLTKSEGLLTIVADMSGKLELQVNTTSSTAKTMFHKLSVKTSGNELMSEQEGEDISEKINVDITRIAKFIHVHAVQPEEVVMALTPDILVFNALIQGGYLTYYIGCSQT
jgi:HUS1 checkpoint protein